MRADLRVWRSATLGSLLAVACGSDPGVEGKTTTSVVTTTAGVGTVTGSGTGLETGLETGLQTGLETGLGTGLETGGTGGLPSDLAGDCPPGENLHGFRLLNTIDEISGHQLWSVDGYVYNGVVPSSVGQVDHAEGSCRVVTTPDLDCEPSCVGGQTCSLDQVCIPYPERQDLGRVHLRGLLADTEIESRAGFHYYMDLPPSPYAVGSSLVLESSGSAFAPASRWSGGGIEPLVVGDAQWTVAIGQPLSLNWVPPQFDLGSEIEFYLSIDEHGFSRGRLVCRFPDTGHAVVPAGMIERLAGVGVSGLPSGYLDRLTADFVQLPGRGCVPFQVRSTREVLVERVGEGGL